MKRLVVLVVATIGLAAGPAAADDYPPSDNLVTVSDSTPCPGQSFSIQAKTFAPGTTVTVTLLPDAVLGTPTAGEDGTVTLDVTLSATQTLGTQTIQVAGTGEAPLSLTAKVDVVSCEETPATTAPTVTTPGGGGDLPRTGSSDSTMTLLKVGGGLAAAGGVLVALAATRRRRGAAAAA